MILKLKYLITKCDKLRGHHTIGLCHGCFDLLHYGHLQHLKEAKEQCDILIVTVTRDIFIDKGVGRPIFNEEQRAEMLNELRCVDYVSLNAWSTAVNTIKGIKPDIFFKGIDYIDECDEGFKRELGVLKENNGKLIVTNTKKYSSTDLVRKLNESHM